MLCRSVDRPAFCLLQAHRAAPYSGFGATQTKTLCLSVPMMLLTVPFRRDIPGTVFNRKTPVDSLPVKKERSGSLSSSQSVRMSNSRNSRGTYKGVTWHGRTTSKAARTRARIAQPGQVILILIFCTHLPLGVYCPCKPSATKPKQPMPRPSTDLLVLSCSVRYALAFRQKQNNILAYNHTALPTKATRLTNVTPQIAAEAHQLTRCRQSQP